MFSIFFVGSMFLFVPQSVNAGWCYKTDSEAHCFSSGDDAQDKTDCENSQPSSSNKCQKKEGSQMTEFVFVNDGTQYCHGGDGVHCYSRHDDCGDNCEMYENGKFVGVGVEKGMVWCDIAGDKDCYDSKAECESHQWISSCRKEYAPDRLYCFFKEGLPICFPTLDDCEKHGIDVGLFYNSCTEINPRESTIAQQLNLNGGGVGGNIKLNGSFDYTPLESSFISKENAYLPNFLKYIFDVGVAIVGLAALLMMTIGGITYITSAGNNAMAEKAKKMIRDAAVGLLLVFFSWLILFVINPDLVGIGENLEKLTRYSVAGDQQSGGSGNGSGGRVANGDEPYSEEHMQKEDRVRDILSQAGVQINKGPCTSPGAANCTDVGELPQKSIDAIVGLKKDCGSACQVVVTGGTERGHISHGPGKNVFDLAKASSLEGYFPSVGIPNVIPQFGTTRNARAWDIKKGPLQGARVVAERNPLHYHIYWP